VFASHLASPAEQPQRDLACADLWERSLERSRRRREVAALHRKHAPRRKGVSLAMSAALLASPMVPLASAASGGNGSAPTEEPGSSDAEGALAGDAILRQGDTGAAVAAVQRKLNVDDDGIFGPITEGAVEAFQGRSGLPVTGEVDARTWTALFRAAVSFVPRDTPAAQAIQASANAEPVAGGAAEDDTTPVETQEGDRPRVAGASAPIARAASAQPASAPASSDEESHSGEDSNEARSDRRASSRGSSGGGSSDGQSEVDGSEGGSRPAAGANRQSDTDRDRGRSDRRAHDHRAEGSDRGVAESVLTPVVTTGGDCATGKLAMPTRGVRTSGFGDGRNHAGIDIGAPMGTAVNAALCGTVTMAGVQGGYGNIVCIRHTASFSTCYAHLSSINTRAGAYVKVGQLIGRVGSTGRSTGPHLHFETRVNGRAEDPDQYLKRGKRVPGGGSEARAASSSDSQRASTSRRESGSTQSTSSSSQYASAPSQQGSGSGAEQEYAAGGGTPPNGTASQSEQQAAPAEQQPAPAEQQAQSSSEATVTAQATTPEPATTTSPEAPAEEPAQPAEEPAVEAEVATEPAVEEPAVEEPAVEAEVAVEAPAPEPQPASAAPADEAEPAAEPAVEEPVVEADAAVEAPAAEVAPEAVEAPAAEVAPEAAVEAPAAEVAPEAVEAPAVEVAPEATVEATTPVPAG